LAKQDSLEIRLIYPQKSNAPKRELKRIEKPVIVKGRVPLNVAGIKSSGPKKKDNLYIEYFLDNELVYSSQNKGPLQFILDTRLYADGRHTLVVNLWDKDGPSAIGIKEIIIQNQVKDEADTKSKL